MQERIRIKTVEPKAYEAMTGLEKYLRQTQLTPIHKDLIKIRASQINGCAYCIQMHTKDARAQGETEQRIYALSAWRESPYFTEEEKIILEITEQVTLIASRRIPDETYSKAIALLGENYLAQIIMCIVTINAWNRIAISTNMPPEE